MTCAREPGGSKAAGETVSSFPDGETYGKSFPYAAPAVGLWAAAGREMSFVISGSSMEPVLTAGDRVTVKSVRPGEMKRGDIIAFLSGGRVVVHRLVRRRKMCGGTIYCQKGDNSSAWTWIREEAIIGKIVSFAGRGGVADMYSTPWRWLNPAIGMCGAGRVAFETFLQAAKAATIGHNRGGPFVCMFKGALENALFPLSEGIFLFLLGKLGRRRAPSHPGRYCTPSHRLPQATKRCSP